MRDYYSLVRENTLCRWGFHCKRSKVIMKYDGGKLPLLCRYCYLIIGRRMRDNKDVMYAKGTSKLR